MWVMDQKETNSTDHSLIGLLALITIPIGFAVAFYCNCLKCDRERSTVIAQDAIPNGTFEVVEEERYIHVVEMGEPETIFAEHLERSQASYYIQLGTHNELNSELPTSTVAEVVIPGQMLVSDHHINLIPSDNMCQSTVNLSDEEIRYQSLFPLLYANIVD